MEIQLLRDKSIIFSFLSKSAELQIYCIGDLEDFYWPNTVWYGLMDKKKIRAIALVYSGMQLPTILSFYTEKADFSINLLSQIKSNLPNAFFAHLSPGLTDVFGKQKIKKYYGLNLKMALRKNPEKTIDSNIKQLTINDVSIILDFYSQAYPQNWFDKRMLLTEKYLGYFINKKLVGVSGIHVYSNKFKVAALGNIAVHPDFRGQQIAYKLTTALCTDLLNDVDYIGLNVKSDNIYAIKCYQKVGFETIAKYDECFIDLT